MKTLIHSLLCLCVLAGALSAASAAGDGSAQSALDTERALSRLLARLDEAGGEDPGTLRRLELRLRLHPELVDALPALLRADAVSDGTAASVLRKLEVVGTPRAQAALVRVAGDEGQSAMDRTRALVALGGLTEPTPETLAALGKVFRLRGTPAERDRSNTAVLSLGALGHRLARSGDTARAAAVRGELLRELAAGRDPLERAIVLKALGNLRDPSTAGAVQPLVVDESAVVRAAAAATLGRLGDPAAAPLLSARLVDEPRGIVRAALAGALEDLASDDPGVLELARRQLLAEEHDVARRRLAAYLVNHVDAVPRLRETLTALRVSDPSPAVRAELDAVLR